MDRRGKCDRKILFLICMCFLYFLLLLRFYLCSYYVPDTGLYFSFAHQGKKAQDGFSSLFILLSGFISSMPWVLNLCCLILLTLSIFNIGYFYAKTFSAGIKSDLVVLSVLFSSSVWYYFYGKIFYDFPFAAFSYSLLLLVFGRTLERYRNGIAYGRQWFLLCLLIGFTLSWKPYYIFSVAGLGLLMLANKESRDMLWNLLEKPVNIVKSLSGAAMGFTAGNFNIIFFPQETIDGIRAYRASFDFRSFLFDKGRVIWDHVNDMPFHFSVFHVVGCALFLFMVPLVIHKYSYLVISIFMTICFYLFITYFSPGYVWHGFAFGIFFITFVLFLCAEQKKRIKGFYFIAILSIVLQSITCFGFYIPKQMQWFNKTDEAVGILEEHSGEILSQIESMKELLGESTFSVDVAVKRSRFVANGPLKIHYPTTDQPYCFAENFEFVDVLASKSLMNWRRLWSCNNYEGNISNGEFIFYIVPDCFMELGDVAQIYKYNDFELENTYLGDGYTIFLHKRMDA